MNRSYALGRLKAGVMNKTEAAFRDWLEMRKRNGLVLWYRFEGLKLRLADNCFYTPDFFVMERNSELIVYEVKGFWSDDARVKIKCAAEMYPFRFVAVKAKTKKSGGGWSIEDF